jgi:hypothetical protein
LKFNKKEEFHLKRDLQPTKATEIFNIVSLNFLDFYQFLFIKDNKFSEMGRTIRKCEEQFDEELMLLVYLLYSEQSHLIMEHFKPMNNNTK